MRTLVFISALFLALSSLAQVNDERAFFDGTYSKDYIRRYKIRTVTGDSYMDSSRLLSTLFYFDTAGLLQQEKIVDSVGKETSRFIFKYNERRDLTMRVTLPQQSYRGDTAVFNKVYEGNNLVEERLPGTSITVRYFYNNKGQKIRSEHPYNSGHTEPDRRVVVYEYDKEGKLVHVTDCIYIGTTTSWMSDRQLVYVGKKLQKIIERIPNGDFPTNQGSVQYSYDEAGNITSIVSDAVTSSYYTYDKRGLLIDKREKLPEDFGALTNTKLITHYSYTFWK